jgi:FKBP-type peptidyl-prolyl cis-trans isomerase
MRKLEVGIAIVVVLVVVALFFVFGNPFGFMSNDTTGAGGTGATDSGISSAPSTSSTASSSLVVQDQSVGSGATAQPGETLTVNYTGKLEDGTVFDTSIGKQPFSFVLGAGQVIPGWDQGLVGMKVGGERTLIIPPSLGYGAQAVGPIPANSTLIFDVTLISVAPASATPSQQ